jgi:hypothetical protein
MRSLSRWVRALLLLHDLRLEPELLGALSLVELRHCLNTGYKQRQLSMLFQVIESLQKELG